MSKAVLKPAALCLAITAAVCGQTPPAQVKISLDQAIRLALQHNHALLAARTGIQQNLAQEITANLRPNPTLQADINYRPVTQSQGILNYLHDSSDRDYGVGYLFERGQKRQHRLAAAKDATSVTRSQVNDSERTLSFQVAQLFVNVQLADSTVALTSDNLKSFRNTVDVSEAQFKSGALSENDYLKIKLQLIQFESDLEQAQLARVQALSDLRQQLGYEVVPADFTVEDDFEYKPVAVTLEELQAKALQSRPDLRAAQLSVIAAESQHELAKANGKQDVSVSGNYGRAGDVSTVSVSVSIPLPVFDRNQGNIAQTRYAVTQAQQQRDSVNGQVLTDVRDAWEGLQTNERVVKIYLNGNLDTSKRSRDIAEYAYHRGATTLLDFLDTERSYRATQLAYRQALAAYLTSLEQVREAVGTRSLN
jgi:cobalt-zinc-cadmium efflux system outer membrane protein